MNAMDQQKHSVTSASPRYHCVCGSVKIDFWSAHYDCILDVENHKTSTYLVLHVMLLVPIDAVMLQSKTYVIDISTRPHGHVLGILAR